MIKITFLFNWLGGHLLEMTHKVNSVEEGCKRMAESLNNGTALEKFKQMLIKQNVAERIAHELCYGDTTAVLPMAKLKVEIKSTTSGTLKLYVSKYRAFYIIILVYWENTSVIQLFKIINTLLLNTSKLGNI